MLDQKFRSAVPVCDVSCGSSPQKRCLLSCMPKRAVEQTVDMQVSRKHMKVRLCHCYVICHSVIDDITGPCVRWNHWLPEDSRRKGSLE